jgi:carbonic anhydrase
VAGEHVSIEAAERRPRLVAEQHPFAIILGCADSRAPAELVFDQGLGDLFVIRVAGNVVAPSLIGSIEYAAEVFGTRLVVVMGHSHCGAVQAAVEELDRPTELRSPNLRSIVERIRPSIETVRDVAGPEIDRETLVSKAIRANVRASVTQLRASSTLLERLIEDDALLIVGAEYALETGVVEFFEGVPE